MNEQQKARIVELARSCELNLTNAPDSRYRSEYLRAAKDRSAEAFRIAQEAG